MNSALIGYTGFVGSNLLLQREFTDLYNSKNINTIEGKEYDEIWCAGVQAVKWWANQNPLEDLKAIDSLLNNLRSVRAKRFILISTVDVFANPVNVDETTEINTEKNHAYGIHRRKMELEILNLFENCTIVRLPGLYGSGLKKNLIYDLMTQQNLAGFHPDSMFQFYNLDRLVNDIKLALSAQLEIIHLTTEPVSVSQVASACFGVTINKETEASPILYDMRTMHAKLWQRDSYYLDSANEVLTQIRAFASNEKN